MSKIQELFDTMMADDNISKFKMKSRGYTQQELASIFNTSQTAISYLLNNDYDPHP